MLTFTIPAFITILFTIFLIGVGIGLWGILTYDPTKK